MREILDALSDDNEYYNGVGRKFLSNSDIEALLTNPHDFKKPKGDNKSFAEGRYFHQLLIEPEKAAETPFVDVASRNTKTYKEFCEEHNFEYVLLWKEIEKIRELAQTMKSNITFFDEIYRDGNQYEVPAIGEIAGEMWKGKADIVTDDSIIDLKTTSDINKFKYSAKSYNYDSQCYLYQELFGKPLVFFVIDKVTGQLGIFEPTQNFVNGGRAKVERAVEIYRKYFGEDPEDDIRNYFIFDSL